MVKEQWCTFCIYFTFEREKPVVVKLRSLKLTFTLQST